MDALSIGLSRVFLAGTERLHLENVLDSGNLSGPGLYSRKCEEFIAEAVGPQARCLLVPSCTAALELAALLIDLGPGDEVILPSFTFVSTANAVVLRGAIPVFADVDPVTLNLSPEAVRKAITGKTKAIMPIHYAGVPADMDAFREIADEFGLVLIEDAAQAFGSSRGGRPAGAFAPLAAFSFHATKNIVAGEAGALVINDPALIARAEIMRDKGTNRASFLSGHSAFYTWQDVGSSFVVSELAAAFLYGQLEALTEIQERRARLWEAYQSAFAGFAADGVFATPAPPVDVHHNSHIYFLVLPSPEQRDALKSHLAALGISSASHFEPLHLSPAGRRFGRTSGSLTVTESKARQILRLPLYVGLEADQSRVIDAVRDWVAFRLTPKTMRLP